MTAPRNLLRAQLERDARSTHTLSGRIARWLSDDVRKLGGLRLELERCRLNHRHEMSRLQALLDKSFATNPRKGAVREVGPDGDPEMN